MLAATVDMPTLTFGILIDIFHYQLSALSTFGAWEEYAMIIQNYGLFWKRDHVNWGTHRGNPGQLKGAMNRTNARKPVDFSNQCGIYALYNDSMKLIYVGQAGFGDTAGLLKRLNNHRSDDLADRWTKFSWFGICGVKLDQTLAAKPQSRNNTLEVMLNHLEAILIAVAEPPSNKQGGKFGRAQQYHQYHDIKEPDLLTSEMIKEMYDDMKARKQAEKPKKPMRKKSALVILPERNAANE